MEQDKIITVVGGTGFLGRAIVSVLASAGYRVQILSRHPERAYVSKPAGDVGQITARYADLAKPESYKGLLKGSYAVVNLVGLLYESGKSQTFAHIHAQGAEHLAQAAYAEGVERFVQMSALGVDRAKESDYARTKYRGEQAVEAAFEGATILRPSVVFGAEDNFYNQFGKLSVLSPFLPAIGGGDTKFQPVYVSDVADAVLVCLENEDTSGRVFELGGPEVLSFKEMLRFVLKQTKRCAGILPVPNIFAKLLGLGMEMVAKIPFAPAPMLTRDQVKLLAYDNVVSEGALTLEDLGIHAVAPSSMVPSYLKVYQK